MKPMNKAITPFRVALALMALSWLVVSLACNSGSKVATNKNAGPACAPTAEPVVASNASGALIVTDISGSMRGFAQPGSVRLFSLHDAMERALRNAIASVESNAAIKRCYLGTELNCNANLTTQAMDNPGTYSATDSRLDLFLAPAAKPEDDPIDPYRMAVLITDGMQAQQPGGANGGPCMAGADPNCMAHLLKQRVEKGYGVWLALLLVPFRGTHYAERPLDDSQWQAIQQHVAGLAQDPLYQGIAFNVQRGSGTPFKAYGYQGVKPLMILALAKNKELGRHFMEQLASLMKAANVVQPANAVYTMELAPLAVKTRKITRVALASTAAVEGVKPVEGKRPGEFFDYLLDCQNNGQASFVITTDDQGGSDHVPDGINVTYNLAPVESSTFPKGHLTIASSADKTYEARLSCQQIREGEYEAWFKLQAEMKMDANKPAFWQALSSENMFEAPERLYGLKYLVQTLLDSVIAQPRTTDCLRFRINRN